MNMNMSSTHRYDTDLGRNEKPSRQSFRPSGLMEKAAGSMKCRSARSFAGCSLVLLCLAQVTSMEVWQGEPSLGEASRALFTKSVGRCSMFLNGERCAKEGMFEF